MVTGTVTRWEAVGNRPCAGVENGSDFLHVERGARFAVFLDMKSSLLGVLALCACSNSVLDGAAPLAGPVNLRTFAMMGGAASTQRFIALPAEGAIDVMDASLSEPKVVAHVALPWTTPTTVGSDGDTFVACGGKTCMRMRESEGAWQVEPWLSGELEGAPSSLAYQQGRWVIVSKSSEFYPLLTLVAADGHVLKTHTVLERYGYMPLVSSTPDGFLMVWHSPNATAEWLDLDLAPLSAPIYLGVRFGFNAAIAASAQTASISLPPAYGGHIVRIDHERVLAQYELPNVEGASKLGARFGLVPGMGESQDLVFLGKQGTFAQDPVDVAVTADLASIEAFSVVMVERGGDVQAAVLDMRGTTPALHTITQGSSVHR